MLPLGCGSTGAPAWAVPAQGSLDAAAGAGFAGCGHRRRAGVVLTALFLAGAALALALPGVATPGKERLRCGRSHNSRKLWALLFVVLNMRVATVSPDYLI